MVAFIVDIPSVTPDDFFQSSSHFGRQFVSIAEINISADAMGNVRSSPIGKNVKQAAKHKANVIILQRLVAWLSSEFAGELVCDGNECLLNARGCEVIMRVRCSLPDKPLIWSSRHVT